jgi:hypothetical protein
MDAIKKTSAAMATAFVSDTCNYNHQQQADVSSQPAGAYPSKLKIGRARLLRSARQACRDAGVPAAVLLFVACSLFGTARRVGDRPWDLAFVAFAYSDLAGLFLCLRRAERLQREPSPAAEGQERRVLQMGVWALSASLSCVFALRLSLIAPSAALVIVVWSMTAFVVLLGFCVLVVCKDQDHGYWALQTKAMKMPGKLKGRFAKTAMTTTLTSQRQGDIVVI